MQFTHNPLGINLKEKCNTRIPSIEIKKTGKHGKS